MKLKPILEKLYPLNRSLNTIDNLTTIDFLRRFLPNSKPEYYQPGEKAWTWTIPERWNVKKAYIEVGNQRLNFVSPNSFLSPINVVSYSLPVNKIVDYEELKKHIYYNPHRRDSIPWVYKYYDRDWGFCISDNQWRKFPTDAQYHVVIESEFTGDPFSLLTSKIGRNPNEILLMAHICHAAQANDDLSGVVTLLEVAERLRNNPLPANSLSVRFLFAPETIGSIVYLARHGEDNIKAGIFAEMTGTSGELWMHQTHEADHDIDSIARECVEFMRPFGSEPCNDERVLSSVGIPCISINRWPYLEYHTSDDNPSIISESQLQKAADVIERIVRIYATNYVPIPEWHGYPFLSGMGKFSRLAQKIVLFMDGKRSVFEISQEIGEDYFAVYNEIEVLLK